MSFLCHRAVVRRAGSPTRSSLSLLWSSISARQTTAPGRHAACARSVKDADERSRRAALLAAEQALASAQLHQQQQRAPGSEQQERELEDLRRRVLALQAQADSQQQVRIRILRAASCSLPGISHLALAKCGTLAGPTRQHIPRFGLLTRRRP